MAAVDSIDAAAISNIKGFKQAPNESVEKAFKCVMFLVEKKTSVKTVKWKDIQSMIAVKFLDKLKEVNDNKDDLPKKCLTALESYLKKNQITEEDVAKGSQDAEKLFIWVKALLSYSHVVKEIAPLKEKVAAMNKEFDESQALLAEQTAALETELKKVKDLEDQFVAAKKEKQQLDDEVILTQQRLERAEKLTTGLAGEHVRWKENIAVLEDKIRKLVGDVFISSACISYYAPFTGKFRQKLVSKWLQNCQELNIPASEVVTLEETMGDPVSIQDWNMKQLPTDSVSIANGIIVDRGKRRPLMIDPQL